MDESENPQNVHPTPLGIQNEIMPWHYNTIQLQGPIDSSHPTFGMGFAAASSEPVDYGYSLLANAKASPAPF